MSNKIKVKVNLFEFTYKDKKGYHTVVGCGEVPPDNQEIKTALEKGYLTEIDKEPVKSFRPTQPKNTARDSSPKK
ncbi:MAG: hypothetical protein WBB37_07585 [bacterium]